MPAGFRLHAELNVSLKGAQLKMGGRELALRPRPVRVGLKVTMLMVAWLRAGKRSPAEGARGRRHRPNTYCEEPRVGEMRSTYLVPMQYQREA